MDSFGIAEYDDGWAEAEDDIADILRSLPRPLMPLFEFLYRDAKYSHSSLSA
jgi:hypothetical protein